MKTYLPRAKDFDSKTYLVDAGGKTLGRLATKIATTLIGKRKTVFAYDQWCGDQVVVINAAKLKVSGKKPEQKVYSHYTGYPSGLKTYTYEELMEEKPGEVLRRAVKRMLPKNKLGRQMLKKLRIFTADKHNMQAQKPVKLEV